MVEEAKHFPHACSSIKVPTRCHSIRIQILDTNHVINDCQMHCGLSLQNMKYIGIAAIDKEIMLAFEAPLL